MSKLKIIYGCLFIAFFVLLAVTFLCIKNKEEFQQKVALAQVTRKALEHLMFDLSEAHENTILDVPADGRWYNHITFGTPRQGTLEYFIKEGQLFRANKGKILLVADDIGDLRVRRAKETPDMVEVQVEVKKNVALISNLKIRIHH